MAKNGINHLRGMAQFSLFSTSYLPLFILIIAKQVSVNFEYLEFGGFDIKSINNFITKFGLSSILLVLSIIGLIGFYHIVKNLEQDAKNGFKVTVTDVKNKNNESISYIATYIIPFAFLEFKGWFELFAIIFLIAIIYRIYINSSLILINPVLNVKYALYEVEYLEAGNKRTAFILSKNKYLQETETIKIYEIGHKMYYSI